jgi:Rps23 Pro-64 3,4-dihydroxylase Tpa1-like proline 4-hydroxylase
MTEMPDCTMPVAVLDEFLVAAEWQALMEFSLGRAAEFRDTEVIGRDGGGVLDPATRRSRVLYDLGPFHSLFTQRLATFFPYVLMRLRQSAFPLSQIEIQLTATNDGEFFRVHSDNDAAEVKARLITFVYFFYREPLAFQGGQLRIFDTELLEDGRSVATGPYRLIYPQQNQAVFFVSWCRHEILPVICPSRDLADSRFTVNGWYRQ